MLNGGTSAPLLAIYCWQQLIFEMMNVSKYTIKENLIMLDRLFLKGDEVFIQSYDPVNGRPQKVFLTDRTLIGSISSDFYWEVEKKLSKSLDA